MSVAMTNCGELGWATNERGYVYAAYDPLTDQPWPPMPEAFQALCHDAAVAAGYPDFRPDACLINRYAVGAKLSLHQDKDEPDLRAPIVSVSLGLPAVFQFGGLRLADPLKRLMLEHGDVVVWGGESRLFITVFSRLNQRITRWRGVSLQPHVPPCSVQRIKIRIILDVCERQFTLLADFSCPDCSACNYFFLSGGSIAGLLSR